MTPAPGKHAHASAGAIGPHHVVRRLAVTSTSEIDHAVTLGPFGFERDVVLKRIRHGLDREERTRAAGRLLREAAALARLSHPAIVRLYELTDHAGTPVLVLEHVDGLSLASLLDRLDANGTPLDDACALFVGYRMFCALAAAHGAHDPVTAELAPVVHGDVSPSNVLVPWDGHVKLADFDLGSDPAPGTPGFAAPERTQGMAASWRSDVFSACVVLRELLLRAAFVTTADEPPSLAEARPGLHPSLVDSIERGLVVDPARRAVTAAEIAARIRELVDVESARERLVHHLVAFAGRTSLREARPARPDAPDEVTNPDGSWSFRPTAISIAPPALSVRTVKSARRKRRRVVRTVASLGAAALAVACGLFVLTEAKPLPRTTATAPEQVEAPAMDPGPPVIASAELSSVPDAQVAAAPPKTGRIVTDPSKSAHRIFVDGRTVGNGGDSILVGCGCHLVRVGSAGATRAVDVPCGGEVTVEH